MRPPLDEDNWVSTMARSGRDVKADNASDARRGWDMTKPTNETRLKRTEALSAATLCVSDVNVDSSDEWRWDNADAGAAAAAAAAAAATRLNKTTDGQTDRLLRRRMSQ